MSEATRPKKFKLTNPGTTQETTPTAPGNPGHSKPMFWKWSNLLLSAGLRWPKSRAHPGCSLLRMLVELQQWVAPHTLTTLTTPKPQTALDPCSCA